jgi:PAS domain S-box-containing protein
MKSRVSGKALEGARNREQLPPIGRTARSSQESRFQRLFETAKDGILIVDGVTHKVLEVNPCLATLIGSSREEIQSKDLADIGLFPDKLVLNPLLEKLDKEGLVRFEHLLPSKAQGHARVLEFVCNKYKDGGQAVIQCNVRDISDRREYEQQLREALLDLAAAKQELETRVLERTADLQQRNAELEAFSYSLSHDLRAPIRSIVSFTQLALEEFGQKVGSPATEYLQKAVASAQRLDHLVLDVLAFSKATRNKLYSEIIDLDALVHAILQERPEWSPPHAEVIVERPLLQIVGDRASMTQCLTNLLDNGVKFVRPGVAPQLRVWTKRVGSRVRLCVADNGIGIPDSSQGRVFELFQRAHNGYEGYGIGLAIVRRAVDRMHGTVTLTSEPGKGSTFCLDLPGPE